MEFLDKLDPLLRIFWFVAIPSSLIFIIQTLLSFLGSDTSTGLDADFDSNLDGGDAPFQLFSLRNLVNFLLGFSWTGISFFTTISSKALLIVVSLLIGCAFVALFFLIIKQFQRFAENNSFSISKTLNKTAEVYLTIPAQKQGAGKVLISVNGSVHELEAMTENEKIETGKLVKVVKIENERILIVDNL